MKETKKEDVFDRAIHREMLRRLTSSLPEWLYIIDIKTKNFYHMTDQFLTKHDWTTEEMLEAGWKHYDTTTHPQDRELFAEMRRLVTLKMEELGDRLSQVQWFSMHYRIKYPVEGLSDAMRMHLKMAPIIIDGKLRYGAVSMVCSMSPVSGNLKLFYKNSEIYEEYNFKTQCWEECQRKRLTQQEQHILTMVRVGADVKGIADEMHISPTTVRNIMSRIYAKLGARSVTQAVLLAYHYRLLYASHAERPSPTPHKRTLKPAKRLLDDMLSTVQDNINRGHSINYIAKIHNLSEGSIRYAIKKGRLRR